MAEELAAREQAMIESQERAAKDAEERAATKKNLKNVKLQPWRQCVQA